MWGHGGLAKTDVTPLHAGGASSVILLGIVDPWNHYFFRGGL